MSSTDVGRGAPWRRGRRGSPSIRSGRGETTTSSPAATAIRSSSAAIAARPFPSRLFASSSRHGTATPTVTGAAAGTRLVELVDAAEQRPELVAAEHLLELRAVGRREHDLGRVEVEVEVAPHRRELLRGARLVGVLGDVLAARRAQLVGVLDHALERAVLRDQLAGGLVADARDARDVVGGVALERR